MTMQPVEPNELIPTLATRETAQLRADYPSLEHLEAGNISAWLVERQDQLLIRAKDERTGMNLAKLITLTGGAVGAVCYATSPLALIGTLVAGVGYIWSVAQDLNDSHQFAPVPFVRGSFIEFLEAMGNREAREQWFANRNELVELMNHLTPLERYEFGMLKGHTHTLANFLVGVDAGKRFYAYRWLLDWFINLRGDFPTQQQLNQYLTSVASDPRINYQQVGAIASHLSNAEAFSVSPPQKSITEVREPARDESLNPLAAWLSETPKTDSQSHTVSTLGTSAVANQQASEMIGLSNQNDYFNSHQEPKNSSEEAIDVSAKIIDGCSDKIDASTQVVDGYSNKIESAQISHSNPLIVQIAQIILECFKTHNATCKFVDGVDGYKFIRILLRSEPKTSISSVLRLGDNLFSELGVFLPDLNKAPLISQIKGGVIAVDVAKPQSQWRTAYFRNYIVPAQYSFESPVKLPIGVDLDGFLIEISLSEHNTRSLLVGGLPGGGKSKWAVAAICAIACQYSPDSVKLVLSDVQQVEFEVFKQLPHLFTPVANTVEETVRALKEAEREMDSRQSLFAAQGVTNIDEYNASVAKELCLARFVIFLEEVADIVLDEDYYMEKMADGSTIHKSYAKEFNRLQQRFNQVGRKWGFYLIASTQTPRTDIIPAKIRTLYSAFLAYMVTRPEESRIILGNQDDSAVNLLGFGDGIFMTSMGRNRIQSMLVEPSEVSAINNRVIATYGSFEDQKARAFEQNALLMEKVRLESLLDLPSQEDEQSLPDLTSPSSLPSNSCGDSLPSFTSTSSSLPGFTSNSSPLPTSASTSNENVQELAERQLQDFLEVRQLRELGVTKSDIIGKHWGYHARKYGEGNLRYVSAIKEYGADWIKELRAHGMRVQHITLLVYCIPRHSKKYQFWAQKIRDVLGISSNQDDVADSIENNQSSDLED